MKLDGATLLLQLAAGGLFFCWITTRRREVSIGYGWTVRITFGLLALGGVIILLANDMSTAQAIAMVAGAGMFGATSVAMLVSFQRRKAGVQGKEALRAERKERVAAMIGREVDIPVQERGPEFPPVCDTIAPVFGLIAMLAAAEFAGGPYALAAARLIVGALFLGSVSDAMLLGHWYLVQPGLRREPLKELVLWTAAMWPLEIAVFLWPVGMVQVLNGTIDDGYAGVLGWMWIACAVFTIGLVFATWKALEERYYSAVMAATGLLYLAILTSFGTDLIARAVLNP
jgi:hypothetical protein